MQASSDVRAEAPASPLWIVLLVESALVCAVLALRVEVPTPSAIEIVPGEPPAFVDDTVEVAPQYVPPGRCSDVWLDRRIDTLIDFEVLRQRNGHLGTDERYIVAEAMHELRSCRGGVLEQRIERERRGGSRWRIQRRQRVEMTEDERALAVASLYMQCVPVR